MTAPAPRHHYTFREYLELEEVARVRHEYFGGEIYAMAGGTPEHAAMTAAVTALLGAGLANGRFRVYSSDLRVRVLSTGLATYPDVTVICGASERDPESPTHVTNPRLVVEVLSPSTADYDRGEKLWHYQQIAPLEATLLIDRETNQIELRRRDDPGGSRGFRASTFGPGQVVPLETVGCRLSVDAVFAAARDA